MKEIEMYEQIQELEDSLMYSRQLLRELVEHTERLEAVVDSEFGQARTVEALYRDGDIGAATRRARYYIHSLEGEYLGQE